MCEFMQLDFKADEYLENVLKLERFDSAKSFSKLRQPINKEKFVSVGLRLMLCKMLSIKALT